MLVCKGRQASAELRTLVGRLKGGPGGSWGALSPAPDDANLCEGRNRGPTQVTSRKEQRLWKNPNPSTASDLQGAGQEGSRSSGVESLFLA